MVFCKYIMIMFFYSLLWLVFFQCLMVGFQPAAYQGGFSSLVPSKIYYFAFGLEACKFYRFALGQKNQKKPGKHIMVRFLIVSHG